MSLMIVSIKLRYFILSLWLLMLFGFSTMGQSADTVYILYEDDIENKIKSIKIGKTVKDYPKYLNRTYHIVNQEDIFRYHGTLPYFSNLQNDYFLANDVFLKRRNVLNTSWFRKATKEDYIKTFQGKNTVIYLAEKSRYENGYYTFMRVYYSGFPEM